MRTVFADASYWIALTNKRDSYHDLAVAVSEQLRVCRMLTSEMVLVELMNALSDRGKDLREATINTIGRIGRNPNVTVFHQTHDLFARAFELYRNRLDKGYSLTDCSTMVLMADEGISEILSADRHFEQHGLTVLLKPQK